MERLNTNIGSMKTTLQEAPEVLKAVSMDLPTSVGFSMIHKFVEVFNQSFVSAMRICVETCSMFYVLTDKRLNIFLARILHSSHSNGASLFCMPFKQSHDGNL